MAELAALLQLDWRLFLTELGSRAECPALELDWELSWELCLENESCSGI